jgi:hypothetical protein
MYHRPANILLSHKSTPVLVDFGFAEKYDLSSPKAFHSNLTYSTPEVHIFSALFCVSVIFKLSMACSYLSPERAHGLPHDTHKSDI